MSPRHPAAAGIVPTVRHRFHLIEVQNLAEQTIFHSAPPLFQRTVQETVLLYLRKLIITGELKPGAKIPVDQVAEYCNVSPVPVREALKQLQSEAVVINEPRRGYWVAKHSSEDFAEIQLMTSVLEREAIKLGVPNLTDDDIHRMDNYRIEVEVALNNGDLWETNLAHREMHFVPYRASGMKLLVNEISRLWEHTDHYRVLYLYKRADVQRISLGQHLELVEACRTRDPAVVIESMTTHRDFATATITPGLFETTNIDS